MKLVLTCLSLFFGMITFAQKTTDGKYNDTNTISFIVKFDKKTATKDGFYLGGYVVNIDHNRSKKLNGKTIKITGKVSIEKGLDPKHGTDDSSSIRQGRSADTKHIESPIIEVINK